MEARDETVLEAALRAAVLAGDECAWRTLYDAHFQGLYAYVHYRTGRDPNRTEEILQECWMTAVRRIVNFQPEQGSFAQWLRGIANKLLLNDARKYIRRGWMDGLSRRAEAVQPAQDLQLAEQIAAAYAMLPDRQREVLRAKYEQQHSVLDIAREWGETQKAVESLLSRARRAFREAFRQLEAEEDRSLP